MAKKRTSEAATPVRAVDEISAALPTWYDNTIRQRAALVCSLRRNPDYVRELLRNPPRIPEAVPRSVDPVIAMREQCRESMEWLLWLRHPTDTLPERARRQDVMLELHWWLKKEGARQPEVACWRTECERLLNDWSEFFGCSGPAAPHLPNVCCAAEALNYVNDMARQLDQMDAAVKEHPPAARLRSVTAPRRNKKRNPKLEARDKWIYNLCCKVELTHIQIARKLKAIAQQKEWRLVSTKNRIQQIGNEYAERNSLPLPPARQDK
jgi:hypothetical protein